MPERRPAPLTRRLFVFAAANIILVTLLLLGPLGVPLRETVLHFTAQFFTMSEEGDSWRPMAHAYQHARSGRPEALYDEIFFQRRKRFQYPPSALLVTAVLKRVGPDGAYTERAQYRPAGAARLFSWLFMLMTAAAVAAVYLRSLAAHQPQERLRHAWLQASLLSGLLTVTFYPLVASYHFGQIQTWLNGLFALLCWAWMARAATLAGVLAGALALIKPQYALLLVWGLLRRRWRFVAAGAATVAAGLGLSVACFGVQAHLNYVDVLAFLSRHGEAYYPNQSVNGFLHRLFANGDALQPAPWFPPFHPWVYAGTVLSSTALAAAALWLPRAARGEMADFAIAGLTCTMASPIAWEHHYGILLPLYAYLAPALRAQPVFGRATAPLLAASFVLTSHFLPAANRLAGAPWGLNVAQSYLLAGAGLVLVCLYRLRGGTRWVSDA
jgi:hypothetical protein